MMPGPFYKHILVFMSSPFFPIQPFRHRNVRFNFLKTVSGAISHPFKNALRAFGELILKKPTLDKSRKAPLADKGLLLLLLFHFIHF